MCFSQSFPSHFEYLPHTFRIRRAGYPIRHRFHDFVERYRLLFPGLVMTEISDFKSAARKICQRVLGKRDWQIGLTKVFLKVSLFGNR